MCFKKRDRIYYAKTYALCVKMQNEYNHVLIQHVTAYIMKDGGWGIVGVMHCSSLGASVSVDFKGINIYLVC